MIKEKTTIQILFWVKSGSTIGLGHLSRCRSLMIHFKRYSNCKILISTNKEELVNEFLYHHEFSFQFVNIGSVNSEIDIVIVDDLYLLQVEKKKLRKIAKLLVCIDDEGDGILDQDILIRPNLLNLKIPQYLQAYQYLTGKEYIILHPDFAHYETKEVKRNVNEIIICFGGSDQDQIIYRIIPILKKLDVDTCFHIVVGVAFKSREKLRKLLKSDLRFNMSVNLSNMAEAFFRSDVAIISGGMLLYEACAIGIPTMVICQNESQENEAQVFDKKKAILNAGINQQVSDSIIKKKIWEIVTDYPKRKKLSKYGKQLVSVNGANRIVTKILEVYNNYESSYCNTTT